MNRDEKAIRNLVTQWHKAITAGDVDAILDLISEDVILIAPDKPPLKGRKTLEKGLRKMFESSRIRSRVTIQEVEVAGDLAFCRTRLRIRTRPVTGSSDGERFGHALSVFRKQPDGSWKLARSCRNMIDGSSIKN